MSIRLFIYAIYLVILFVVSGCLGPVKELYPENEQERPVSLFIISHGWHVGVAIHSSEIRSFLPDHPEMPEAEFYMFGWGDNRYYPHPDPGFGLLLRAALLPTPSIIHVVGIDVSVDRYFSGSEIVEIKISDKGSEKFSEFILSVFKTDEDGNIQVAADGLYTNSLFFEANSRYFLPKTSNTWAAKAIRKTGFPISPFYAITSGNVMHQVKKEGRVIR